MCVLFTLFLDAMAQAWLWCLRNLSENLSHRSVTCPIALLSKDSVSQPQVVITLVYHKVS
jgi:hypothetical protein